MLNTARTTHLVVLDDHYKTEAYIDFTGNNEVKNEDES